MHKGRDDQDLFLFDLRCKYFSVVLRMSLGICLVPTSRSPDGSCLMTNSDDNILRLFDIPSGLCQGKAENLPEMVIESTG